VSSALLTVKPTGTCKREETFGQIRAKELVILNGGFKAIEGVFPCYLNQNRRANREKVLFIVVFGRLKVNADGTASHRFEVALPRKGECLFARLSYGHYPHLHIGMQRGVSYYKGVFVSLFCRFSLHGAGLEEAWQTNADEADTCRQKPPQYPVTCPITRGHTSP
jgi:hypothetical protein